MQPKEKNITAYSSLPLAEQLKLSYDIIEAIVFKVAEIPEISDPPDPPNDRLLVSELNRRLFEIYDLLVQYDEIEDV